MSVLYKYFRPTPVISTVAYLASLLPERAVTHVASYCLAKVKETQGWETCVDCLCNWKQGDQLLELVCNWLRAGLGLDQVAGRADKVIRGSLCVWYLPQKNLWRYVSDFLSFQAFKLKKLRNLKISVFEFLSF